MTENQTPETNYNISFFKPTTELARINRNLAIWLISVWFVAIFGFQFLLKLVETPTPEPTYTAFTEVWPQIEQNNADSVQYQTFTNSVLQVLCKVFISTDDRSQLNKAFSHGLYTLSNDKEEMHKTIQQFKKTEVGSSAYNEAKNDLSIHIAKTLGVAPYSLQAKIGSLEIQEEYFTGRKAEALVGLQAIMEKYLIHNQSFLTDSKFLGFPFHYFYTAVFLLILFVGLCLIYCIKTDKVYKKLGIENV